MWINNELIKNNTCSAELKYQVKYSLIKKKKSNNKNIIVFNKNDWYHKSFYECIRDNNKHLSKLNDELSIIINNNKSSRVQINQNNNVNNNKYQNNETNNNNKDRDNNENNEMNLELIKEN